jgi:hypothetical protein
MSASSEANSSNHNVLWKFVSETASPGHARHWARTTASQSAPGSAKDRRINTCRVFNVVITLRVMTCVVTAERDDYFGCDTH